MNLAGLQIFGNSLIQRKIAECGKFEVGLGFNCIDVIEKQRREFCRYFVRGY